MSIEQRPVPHPRFQDRHGVDWYVWKETAVLTHVADMYSDMKRLTDTELAAEFWKARERCMFVSAFSGMSILPDSPTARQAIILHRFATLPSYDEPTTQKVER